MSFVLRSIIPAAIFAAGVAGLASAETLKVAPEQALQAVLDRFPGAEIVAVRDVEAQDVTPAAPDSADS